MSEQTTIWEDITTRVYDEYSLHIYDDVDVFAYTAVCNGLVITGCTVDHENEQIILHTGDAQ